jgi:hypothetical protein
VSAEERGIGLAPIGLPETDTRESPAYSDQARPPPGPPLRARTAFLFATLAAAIGLLVFVARKLARIVSGVRWTRFAAVLARHPASSRANVPPSRMLRGRRRECARSTRVLQASAVPRRALFRIPRRSMAPAIAAERSGRPSFPSLRGIGEFHFGISRHAREEVPLYVLTVVLSVAVGCLVALAAR